MPLQITTPPDAFDMFETVEFRFISNPGQTSKQTLFIKLIKYHVDEQGLSSYSDEPPVEIFIKDVEAYIAESVGEGDMVPYNQFMNSSILVSHVLNKIKGIATTVI